MARRIVLTGVSRGLGRAMLSHFAEQGHTVIGCATNSEAIEGLRTEFPSPHDLDVVDVSDDENVGRWAKRVLDSGPPDLLVNNAALINTSTELWNVHPKEFSTLMNVNVTGTYHVIRHFVPAMIEAGNGVIVNFSSGWDVRRHRKSFRIVLRNGQLKVSPAVWLRSFRAALPPSRSTPASSIPKCSKAASAAVLRRFPGPRGGRSVQYRFCSVSMQAITVVRLTCQSELCVAL